jgi:hypothetical protein
MSPFFRRVWSLIQSSDFERTERYKSAVTWSSASTAELEDQGKAELALQHAKARYEDRLRGNAILDDRLNELLKFDGTVLAALFAVAKLGQTIPSAWLSAAFGCLLLSMALCLRARCAADSPVSASIRSVVDGLANVDHPHTWLARSLHMTVEGMQVQGDVKADRLNVATALAVFALGLLLPLVLGA